jgi:hypothetical protein
MKKNEKMKKITYEIFTKKTGTIVKIGFEQLK